MAKKLVAPVLGLLAVFGLSAVMNHDLTVYAQNDITGLISDMDDPENIDNATIWDGSARQAIRVIVNYFLYFLGLIATVMVIYGGFLYVTSGGDDAGAEKGKKILIYAATGIIIILISYAVVNTILSAGTGNAPANM